MNPRVGRRRTNGTHRWWALTVVALLVAACASDDAPETGGTGPEASVIDDDGTGVTLLPPADLTIDASDGDERVTTSTTAVPADYPSALTNRLSAEWEDAALAEEIVSALSDESLADFEARVAIGDVATDPLFTYQPDRIAPEAIDSVVVFTFGFRGPDTDREPGPVNQAMADAVQAFVGVHPVPVFAQTTVATLLVDAGVPNVTSLDDEVGPDGEVVDLSTIGAVEQAIAKADASDVDLGTVGVVGFEDHVGRCLLTAQSAGLTAGVPDGIALPGGYDPESTQPWTRDRLDYLTVDLAGRLALRTPA